MSSRIVFLEGPAYAGKTTYLRRLDQEMFRCLPEASEFVGGDRHFPEAPTDIPTMLRCTYFFAHMERLRLAQLTPGTLVVADRLTPFSSLLFYHLRYKGGFISSTDYATGILLVVKIFSETLQLPAGTRVGFMRFTLTSQKAFTTRLARGTRNSDFNSWPNFQLLSEWYRKLLPSSTITITEQATTTSPADVPLGEGTAAQRLLQPRHFLEAANLQAPSSALPAAERFISPAEKSAIERNVQELVYGR